MTLVQVCKLLQLGYSPDRHIFSTGRDLDLCRNLNKKFQDSKRLDSMTSIYDICISKFRSRQPDYTVTLK